MPFEVRGYVAKAVSVDEIHRPRRKHANMRDLMCEAVASVGASKKTISAVEKRMIDLSWLKHVSPIYKISPDIKDYVVAAVPLITTDVPNRNMQGVSYKEAVSFNPSYANFTFRSFCWKPTFLEHNNKDVTIAKGVNLDVEIVKEKRFGTRKIVVLSAFDRTKDRQLAEGILHNKNPYFSMGAWVMNYLCSVCGSIVDDKKSYCNHFRNPGIGKLTSDRKIIYQMCHNIDFFENSSVNDPADITAEGHVF